jgi:hypothetical protein
MKSFLLLLILLTTASLYAREKFIQITVTTSAIALSQQEAEDEAYKKAVEEAIKRAAVKIYGTNIVENNVFQKNLIFLQFAGKVSCEPKGKPKVETLKQQGSIYIKVTNSYTCKVNTQNFNDFGMTINMPDKVKPYSSYTIKVSVAKPCYLYIYNSDVTGRVYLIYPDTEQPVLVKKGVNLKLKAYPLPNIPFPQRETLIFVCAKNPSPFFKEGFLNLKEFKDVKNCLEERTCISQQKKMDLLNILSNMKDWEFNIRSIYIVDK